MSTLPTIARAAAGATAAALLSGCMLFARPPQGDSIPRNRLHRWTLHLETAAGAPVDSATVAVDGGMPQHGHGLPTRPRVTRHAGQGDHVVDGMKVNMGGWWVVKFRVAAAAGTDSLVFNLKL